MTPPVSRWIAACLALALLGSARPAGADDGDIVIVIKDGKFMPSDVSVPAGKKVRLIIRNQGTSMSEFESVEFHREKPAPPGRDVSMFVGPLDAGSYEFFDDFHPQNRGHLVVK